MEDEKVIHGPPLHQPIPAVSVGRILYEKLRTNCPNKEAIVDGVTNKYITYNEIVTKSCSLAKSLQNHNYGRNTVVSICSENILEFFIPVLACLYNGLILVPLNPTYTEHELLHMLGITKPKILFCSEFLYKKLLKSSKIQNLFEKIIVINGKESYEKGIESMDDFMKRGLPNGSLIDTFTPVEVDVENQIAFVLSSSGTTGLPKGVSITHKNFLTQISFWNDPNSVFQKEQGKVMLVITPFFHAYGLFATIACMYVQAKVIMLARFDENVYLQMIEKYKISDLFLVPSLANFLAKTPLVNKYNLSSIKRIGCGAAPLSINVQSLLKKRFNVDQIVQAYGLTEATFSVARAEGDNWKQGSVGKLNLGLSLKIRDPETGKTLGPNQIGEICLKGPSIMKGYFNNPKATKEIFTDDGWLLTGDLGYYDQDECLFIVDRLKELIKYKGYQVAPAEIEALLLNHPKIRDVGVVGLPNEEAGELPIAFVVKEGDLTEKEVEDYVAANLSSHKRLRGGVKFVNQIPKNASGKLLRKDLRKLLHNQKLKL